MTSLFRRIASNATGLSDFELQQFKGALENLDPSDTSLSSTDFNQPGSLIRNDPILNPSALTRGRIPLTTPVNPVSRPFGRQTNIQLTTNFEDMNMDEQLQFLSDQGKKVKNLTQNTSFSSDSSSSQSSTPSKSISPGTIFSPLRRSTSSTPFVTPNTSIRSSPFLTPNASIRSSSFLTPNIISSPQSSKLSQTFSEPSSQSSTPGSQSSIKSIISTPDGSFFSPDQRQLLRSITSNLSERAQDEIEETDRLLSDTLLSPDARERLLNVRRRLETIRQKSENSNRRLQTPETSPTPPSIISEPDEESLSIIGQLHVGNQELLSNILRNSASRGDEETTQTVNDLSTKHNDLTNVLNNLDDTVDIDTLVQHGRRLNDLKANLINFNDELQTEPGPTITQPTTFTHESPGNNNLQVLSDHLQYLRESGQNISQSDYLEGRGLPGNTSLPHGSADIYSANIGETEYNRDRPLFETTADALVDEYRSSPHAQEASNEDAFHGSTAASHVSGVPQPLGSHELGSVRTTPMLSSPAESVSIEDTSSLARNVYRSFTKPIQRAIDGGVIKQPDEISQAILSGGLTGNNPVTNTSVIPSSRRPDTLEEQLIEQPDNTRIQNIIRQQQTQQTQQIATTPSPPPRSLPPRILGGIQATSSPTRSLTPRLSGGAQGTSAPARVIPQISTTGRSSTPIADQLSSPGPPTRTPTPLPTLSNPPSIYSSPTLSSLGSLPQPTSGASGDDRLLNIGNTGTMSRNQQLIQVLTDRQAELLFAQQAPVLNPFATPVVPTVSDPTSDLLLAQALQRSGGNNNLSQALLRSVSALGSGAISSPSNVNEILALSLANF